MTGEFSGYQGEGREIRFYTFFIDFPGVNDDPFTSNEYFRGLNYGCFIQMGVATA